MDLFLLEAQEVLTNQSLFEYKQGIDFFYFELAILNTNIHIIRKIKEFPLDSFCGPDEKL